MRRQRPCYLRESEDHFHLLRSDWHLKSWFHAKLSPHGKDTLNISIFLVYVIGRGESLLGVHFPWYLSKLCQVIDFSHFP